MDIIKRKQSFEIRKIEESAQKWICYPKGEEKPIELDKSLVYGKVPPVWKFPWQCHKLNISLIGNFIKKAEMDGLILFDLPEKDFPKEVKKTLNDWRKKQEEFQAEQNLYDQGIKEKIADYVTLIDEQPDIEDEILKLPVCWRLYLKMLWLKQYQRPELKPRVLLMFKLVKLADKLYLRHVNARSRTDIFAKDLSFSRIWRLDFYGYDKKLFDCRVNQPTLLEDEEKLGSFILFNEINTIWTEFLPPIDDEKLMLYMNYVVRTMLSSYSKDMFVLADKRTRNLSGAPISSDAAAYCMLYKKMELPCFASFVIEQSFSEDEIRTFVNNYSLE